MGKKVYAIKEGFDTKNNKRVENIIVDSWAKCLEYVKGVKGAKYKSFEALGEAKKYLEDNEKLYIKGKDSYPMDVLQVYVDGSFNPSTEKYGYGLVAVFQDTIEYLENGAGENTNAKSIRQIAGELSAAVRAVEYAVSKKQNKVVILHDYEGIYHHAVGTWERKDYSSQKYYEIMNHYRNTYGIDITFVKVDSHTGDIYNEVADSLAKKSINMTLTPAVDEFLKSSNIYVSKETVKEELMAIVLPKNHNKILLSKVAVEEQKTAVNDVEETIKKLRGKGEDELRKILNNLDKDIKEEIIIALLK